ncbi:MAG: ABC transporter permease [Acidobacteriota bacterium]
MLASARPRRFEFKPAVVLTSFARKILLQRHLIFNFVVRDLKSRYVGSLMGIFWSLIHPLVLLASYTFVFSVVFDMTRFAATDHFALFLFCGILPWLYFQDTVIRSCTSVVDQNHLIRKTLFPSEILPVTIVLSNLVTHLIGLTILLLALFYYGLLGPSALMIPIYWLLLMLFSLGLGWLAAALQVFLRDTAHVLSVLMVFWFWFTPIFYKIEAVPDRFRFWIELNPLGHVVEGYRRLLLENQIFQPLSLALLAFISVLVFLVGGWVFRRTKREFVDVL